MKIVYLLPFLFAIGISSIGNVCLAHEKIEGDEVLAEAQLEDIFPDYNFRNIVKEKVKPNKVTLNNIKALDGEFYATSEKIEDLRGISMLENIDDFIFWNNNIKKLPKEITKLNDLDYINLANNYISTDETLNLLSKKGVKVNSDLNFINNKNNQYKLESKYKEINISKNEKVDLRKIIEKSINDYYKYWEVSNQLPKDLKIYVEIEDESILSESDMVITAQKKGTTDLKIYITNKEIGSQKTSILVNVH